MSEELSPFVLGAGAVGIGSVLASKELTLKLLGPTADYVGLGTRDLVQKSVENLGRVFDRAFEKLRENAEKDCQVNPRVLKHVWDDGRFVESEIATEYFAGILASARTEDGSDDSALPYSALLNSMSAIELRLHYVLYALVAREAPKLSGHVDDVWEGLEVTIDSDELLAAMGLATADGPGALLLALQSLVQHDLSHPRFSVDVAGVRQRKGAVGKRNSVVLFPNAFGASLILRALGLKGIHPEVLLSVDFEYSIADGVKNGIDLPRRVSCEYIHRSDRVQALADEVESLRFDLESAIDDLKEEMEKRSSSSDDGGGGGG